MKIALLIAILSTRTLLGADLMPHPSGDLSLRNEVQLAIDKGLAWLQKAQNPDGSWSLPEYPAMTAIPLTVFMLEPSGKFRTEKPEFISKGYGALLSSTQPDGGIYRKGLANYNTSLSLMALVAANDPKLAPAITRAREFVVGQQAHGLADSSLDGGIGYGPTGTNSQHPDLSNTAVALDSLVHSKTNSGQELASAKDLNWPAVVAFVQRCQNLPPEGKKPLSEVEADNAGGFIYCPGNSKAGEVQLPDGRKLQRSYGSMSYAGLLSYIYADLKKDDPRVQSVVGWLQKHYTLDENPGMGADGLFYYYMMMSKALGAYGMVELELADGRKIDWRKDLALKLIKLQKADGSWSNESGRWMEKDPTLVTSYSLCALEIIYRAL